MSKIMNVTEARAKFKKILDDIKKSNQSYILTRGSKPEAVIIPYEAYEKNWGTQLKQVFQRVREKAKKYSTQKVEKDIKKAIKKTRTSNV